MKKHTSIYLLMFCIIAGFFACKKPYLAPVSSSNNSYLVIEGLINTGVDSVSRFRLTRTVGLSSTTAPAPELNANVSIEGEDNSSWQLYGNATGIYSSAPLSLANNAKYRLRIKTITSEEYLSDFVEAKETPDIDSVNYQVLNDGVQFYVNTHDPTNKTRYYRWDFDETWGYHALYTSFFKIGDDGYPDYRLDAQDKIYGCYKTIPGIQILLGSTAKLSQDVVYRQPLDFITQNSGKISHGYSLFLRQYALTADGFSYWQNLKKNTEQIGGIFDAQPSELPSNIHCISEPGKPVVGFISASSIKTKRLFVNNYIAGLFVPDYIGPPEVNECTTGYISIDPAGSFQLRLRQLTGTGDTVLTTAKTSTVTLQIVGYNYTAKNCADCRAKQPYGSNLAPDFWPYEQQWH